MFTLTWHLTVGDNGKRGCALQQRAGYDGLAVLLRHDYRKGQQASAVDDTARPARAAALQVNPSPPPPPSPRPPSPTFRNGTLV